MLKNKTAFLLGALFVLVILLFGVTAFRTLSTQEAFPQNISSSVLEEQYGLRVNLVAVTAAGGMVDVRLKVLDAQKAALLLRSQDDYPAILVMDSGIILKAPQDNQQDLSNLKSGSMIYIMAPNTNNSVKPHNPVTILIGEKRLEPVIAQ